MDLDEYLFKEKRKDRSFTVKKFANSIGVSHVHLNRVKRGTYPLSAELAYVIDKVSGRKVDVMAMIRDYYDKNDM